jgi:hypothetical protein
LGEVTVTLQGKMGKVIVVVSVCEGVAVCACRTGPAAVPRGGALAGLAVLVTKRGCASARTRWCSRGGVQVRALVSGGECVFAVVATGVRV